jgi:hypothetical protein
MSEHSQTVCWGTVGNHKHGLEKWNGSNFPKNANSAKLGKFILENAENLRDDQILYSTFVRPAK